MMGDSKELHWMDIAVVAEFKKKDNTKNVADVSASFERLDVVVTSLTLHIGRT